jgi:hypothetical protein
VRPCLKETKKVLGMVAQVRNPSYEGGRDGRIVVRPVQAKKGSKSLSQQTRRAWWYMPIIPATNQVEVGGLQSEVIPRQKVLDPISKIT